MKIRRVFFTGFLFSLLSVSLSAQTAAMIENLLDEKAVKWSMAAAFVLDAADKGVEFFTLEGEGGAAAFRFASEKNWLPKNAVSGDAARLNGIALLLARAFDIKGGIFFRLTGSPHHAYRELVYREVIRGNTDPGMTVSGQELLLMINRLLAIQEQAELKAAD